MSNPATFTPQARADIRGAGVWIARDSRSAAQAFREAIASVARLIGEHPQVGAERPDIARKPYRFFVVRGFPHVVVYDPSHDPPSIVRVLHGARDLPEVLRDL